MISNTVIRLEPNGNEYLAPFYLNTLTCSCILCVCVCVYCSLGVGGDWRHLNLIFNSIYSSHTFDCNAILIIKYILLWILCKEYVYHTIQSKLTSWTE